MHAYNEVMIKGRGWPSCMIQTETKEFLDSIRLGVPQWIIVLLKFWCFSIQ